MMPHVFISLLNWMNYSDTIHCVESLKNLNYSDFTLIIRDNASPNDSFEKLTTHFPEYNIVRSAENNGFAAGHYENYLLAKEIGADLFWIINADLEVDINALSELVKDYQENGNHIYGSVSLNPKNPELVDFGGAAYGPNSDSKLTYNTWKHKPYKDLLVQYPKGYEVESVEGSSMLIPMSLIEKYGFMKLDFFMYGEETDYCYRMRKHSVKSFLVTKSFVKHHNEGSTQQFPRLKIIPIYYRRRNALRFSIEHLKISRFKSLTYQSGFFGNLKALLKGIFTKEKEFSFYFALACFHATFGIKGKKIYPEKFI